MNVDSARRCSIELRPMLPDQAGQVGTDAEDPYARVGEAKGLSRYIPAQKLRSMTMPRTLAASLRPMPAMRTLTRVDDRARTLCRDAAMTRATTSAVPWPGCDVRFTELRFRMRRRASRIHFLAEVPPAGE